MDNCSKVVFSCFVRALSNEDTSVLYPSISAVSSVILDIFSAMVLLILVIILNISLICSRNVFRLSGWSNESKFKLEICILNLSLNVMIEE